MVALVLGGGCAAASNDASDQGDSAPSGAAGVAGAGGASAGAGGGTQGNVDQPCFPNKTCFGTLVCASGICVDLSTVQGGASGSAAGGSSNGGSGTAGSSAGGASVGGASAGGASAGGAKGGSGNGGSSAGQAGAKGGAGGSSAGTSAQGGASAGTSMQGGSGGVAFGAGGSSAGASTTGGAAGVGGGCAGEVYTATQDPAALMFVLDRSVSMAKQSKWTFLSQAVNQVLATSEFDTMVVGALAAPSGETSAPQCLQDLGLSQVPCLVPDSPQLPLTLVGTAPATDMTSFRYSVQAGLAAAAPSGSFLDPDASPLYGAIQNGIKALQGWPNMGKRIMVIITDGSIDCTSLSNPARSGYPDANGCSNEWENPQNIADLVAAANADPNTPVQTFVVGVPGADTYDASGANFPPYHMRLALSAIAYAGAPMYVPQNCTGKTYTQSGGDPTVPCHFDMTTGNFSAAQLATDIANVRAATLGCSFLLPVPAMGTVNPNEVNVEVDTGSGPMEIPRRNDPTDMCTNDPCWDYDASGNVVLIGQECSVVEGNGAAQVTIVVGCDTIHKP